jgi:hypothetical protein
MASRNEDEGSSLLTLQVDPNRRDVDVTNKPFFLDGEESLDGCARRQR